MGDIVTSTVVAVGAALVAGANSAIAVGAAAVGAAAVGADVALLSGATVNATGGESGAVLRRNCATRIRRNPPTTATAHRINTEAGKRRCGSPYAAPRRAELEGHDDGAGRTKRSGRGSVLGRFELFDVFLLPLRCTGSTDRSLCRDLFFDGCAACVFFDDDDAGDDDAGDDAGDDDAGDDAGDDDAGDDVFNAAPHTRHD
ncbi:MAG: hypothetical protein NTZ50_15830 [Chloroflexi bacterium]|nr:hypothetical protein [Chloroflexota bacterium]